MDKTMRLLCMATLVVMGTIITGCANLDENQQLDKNNHTLTATLSFSDNAGTKTLTAAGVKTFAVDDQVVLFYVDGEGLTRRVVSSALTAGDITNEGKKANLTFDVSAATPATDGAIRYVYPAYMASTNQDSDFNLDDEHTIDFTQLDYQKGTLDDLGTALDLATFDGNFSGTSLPASATLTNQLAVLAITLTDNAATPADITSSITDLVVVEGANHYAVTREAAAGPIYVAIKPTSSAVIEVAASDGTNDYGKFLTSKTYAANNGYNVSWKMLPWVRLSALGASVFDVTEDMILTGTPAAALTIFNNDGYTVTLDNVNPEGEVAVKMNANDFTLKLKGTSKLTWINSLGCALTIGEAVAGGTVIIINSSGYSIMASTVTVNGGTVKVKAKNNAVRGNLTVNGGAVYLEGGDGYNAVDGTISGSATLYGWGGIAWGAATGVQYVTTDNSAAPSSWAW